MKNNETVKSILEKFFRELDYENMAVLDDVMPEIISVMGSEENALNEIERHDLDFEGDMIFFVVEPELNPVVKYPAKIVSIGFEAGFRTKRELHNLWEEHDRHCDKLRHLVKPEAEHEAEQETRDEQLKPWHEVYPHKVYQQVLLDGEELIDWKIGGSLKEIWNWSIRTHDKIKHGLTVKTHEIIVNNLEEHNAAFNNKKWFEQFAISESFKGRKPNG